MVEAGLILLAGVAMGAEGGWRDGFDGPQLHARWRKVVPLLGPRIRLDQDAGRLCVALPERKDGFDLWLGRQQAPLLLTAAPKGDFVYEGHVRVTTWSREGNVHMGLVVGFGEGSVLSWGPFYSKIFGGGQKTLELWAEATGLGCVARARGDWRSAHLRIEKNGRRYTLSMKHEAGEQWQTGGTFDAAFPPKYVGILGKTYGPGDNAAAAEFDDVSVTPKPAAPVTPLTAAARIGADKPNVVLNPLRYGHFVEHLGKCIYGGLWAERLHNRKFTGSTTKGVVEGWQPIGRGKGVTFSNDSRDYYCPSQSQIIEAAEAGSEHGILQGGIEIEAGRECTGYVIAKQRDLDGPVTVSLRDGDCVLASADVGPVAAEWAKRPFKLKARAGAKRGAFAVTTKSAGKLWLGVVSLMPADNVDGWRRDVIEACKLSRPPIVRYPGGNFVSGYHWRDGIGPRDRRPPRWERAWKAWEWNDVGIDEFMTLTRRVGWTPYIVVNCGEGQSDEAAEWVEYCNGGPDTRWGSVRAKNGHVEPYGIKHWGIGNEIYGLWQLGHLDATRYALKAVEFARAMKAVDPTIELIGVGVEADQFDGWNEKVVKIAGPCFDWLSVHHYVAFDVRGDRVANYANIVHAPIQIESMLARTARLVRQAHGDRPIPLAFDEWNVAPVLKGATGKAWSHNIAQGLYAAGVFHTLHRLAERVPMANHALLVNPIGALQVRQTAVLQTPTYLAFRLYGNSSGHRRVPVRLSGVPSNGPTPLVDVIAAIGKGGRTLHVHAINRHPTEPIKMRWDLSGFEPAGPVHVVELAGSSWQAQTTLAKPDGVRLVERDATWAKIRDDPLLPHAVRGLVIRRR